jgi:hypothetical protein
MALYMYSLKTLKFAIRQKITVYQFSENHHTSLPDPVYESLQKDLEQ